MSELDLPYLVYVKNPDGSKTYFYRNTIAEKEANFLYEVYLKDKEKHKDCKCLIHRGK